MHCIKTFCYFNCPFLNQKVTDTRVSCQKNVRDYSPQSTKVISNLRALRISNLASDQDLTRSGACDEHVSAEIADRNVISATRHTKMARATPNNTKAARKEAKLKYKLKP